MQVPVESLRRHPFSTDIYYRGASVSLEDDFLESIQQRGILEPIVVRKATEEEKRPSRAVEIDGEQIPMSDEPEVRKRQNKKAAQKQYTIISGHRRWWAATVIGLDEVPVRVVEFDDELDEREAIIFFNKQREKTFSQKMREADALEEVERERAKERMLAGKALGPSQKSDGGRTDERVAKKTGLGSRDTFHKAKKVWEKAKQGDEKAEKLMDKLDRGKVSVHKAYTEITRTEEPDEEMSDWEKIQEDGKEAESQFRKFFEEWTGVSLTTRERKYLLGVARNNRKFLERVLKSNGDRAFGIGG